MFSRCIRSARSRSSSPCRSCQGASAGSRWGRGFGAARRTACVCRSRWCGSGMASPRASAAGTPRSSFCQPLQWVERRRPWTSCRRHKEKGLALGGLNLGSFDGAEPDAIPPELLPPGLVARHIRQTRDALPLKSSVATRTGSGAGSTAARHGGGHPIAAVGTCGKGGPSAAPSRSARWTALRLARS